MRLVFSSLAVTELDTILHYIATKNPQAAARVVARFDEVFDRIAHFPRAGIGAAFRRAARAARPLSLCSLLRADGGRGDGPAHPAWCADAAVG